MNSDFVKKLSLWIYKTKFGAQKIDGSKLYTFVIIIALFSMEDNKENSRFFKELFLLADMCMDIALSTLFLILSNIEIDFIYCYIH